MNRSLAAALIAVLPAIAHAGPERDYNEPPPGCSTEDAALWRDLRHGTSWSLWQLARVAQASSRIHYGKYYERLDAAIHGVDGPPAWHAQALRDRLVAAATAAERAIPPDGGRVHPCRVVLLDFEQRIDPRNTGVAGELPEFRAETQRCAERMNRLLAAVTPAADEIEKALDAVDAFLGRDAPPPPPGTATPGPAPRS